MNEDSEQTLETASHQLTDDGYLLFPDVFSSSELQSILDQVSEIDASQNGAITARTEKVIASRNVIELVPNCLDFVRNTIAAKFLLREVGSDAGLVRVLYFDKPPWRSWTLPWHKDMTIAVRDNQLPSEVFSKPTVKSGVCHVEAPTDLLEQMLTLRIHLDPHSAANGALKVVPGSHRNGKLGAAEGEPMLVESDAGAVLAMRPLLSHASSAGEPETTMHRRTLHFEFAPSINLPDGYQWQHFVRVASNPKRESVSEEESHLDVFSPMLPRSHFEAVIFSSTALRAVSVIFTARRAVLLSCADRPKKSQLFGLG